MYEALDLGCGAGHLRAALEDDAGFDPSVGSYAGGIRALTECDSSRLAVEVASGRPSSALETSGVVADEEEALPFESGSFDCVLSSLSLRVPAAPAEYSALSRAVVVRPSSPLLSSPLSQMALSDVVGTG